MLCRSRPLLVEVADSAHLFFDSCPHFGIVIVISNCLISLKAIYQHFALCTNCVTTGMLPTFPLVTRLV